MKIDMSPILSGAKSTIDFSYPLKPDVAKIMPGVVFPKPFTVNGQITNSAGYMALSLCAVADYEAACDRCLQPVSSTLTVEFKRTVALPGTLIDENDDDYIVIEENAVDVDIPLLEEILLSVPSKILCREDCKGLCPKCGQDLNTGACSCSHKEIDPRLAVLAKLLDTKDET
ncbi:MAG: DUF177 domain-containing protein [Clostridiales bacterium]|nr:DUF177 domain-containing protein [Clostridiales bacterium]